MTPSAQLLEQTARLQSLRDTLGRLKVTRTSTKQLINHDFFHTDLRVAISLNSNLLLAG